jgi:thioredoxin-like negative regulator of GroEL
MNQVAEIPADSFERAVKRSDKPVIVEFWIKSCGNCQKFRPVYEKLPEIFGDKVEFLKMNMLLSLEKLKLAEGLGVEETPTLKLFCNGRNKGHNEEHSRISMLRRNSRLLQFLKRLAQT